MGKEEFDYIVLILNIFFWLIGLRFYSKKYGFKNLGVSFIAFYSIISILALHLFYNSHDNSVSKWGNISLAALLYLYFFIMLFCHLLLRPGNATEIEHVKIDRIYPLILIVIILTLLDIIPTIQNFKTGLVLLAIDSDYGNEIYTQTTLANVHTARISNGVSYIGVLKNCAKNLSPVLLLYYLIYSKPNKFILIGLILSTFTTYMSAISLGLRSVIIQNLLSFGFLYLFINKFYRNQVKRIIRPIFISLFSLIVLGTLLITISRVSAGTNTGKANALEFVESYAGQSILYFGTYGMDNGDQIREGDRTFPLVKSLFSDDVARSTYERRLKYRDMKINESVFSTFVGDFVFDFGVFGGAIVLFALYYIFKNSLNKIFKRIYFDQILILYLVIYLLCGFYLYPLGDYAGNMMLISIILLSLFYKNLRYGKRIYK